MYGLGVGLGVECIDLGLQISQASLFICIYIYICARACVDPEVYNLY